METKESYLCPSNRCKPGSELLGIRQDDGTVAILPKPLPINDQFIKIVNQDDTPPEQRFRFTNKCVESGCKQWTGNSCGVIEKIVQHLDELPVAEHLPECSIRPQCRWYHQRKVDACKACPFIITEISEEQVLELQRKEI